MYRTASIGTNGFTLHSFWRIPTEQVMNLLFMKMVNQGAPTADSQQERSMKFRETSSSVADVSIGMISTPALKSMKLLYSINRYLQLILERFMTCQNRVHEITMFSSFTLTGGIDILCRVTFASESVFI